MIVCLLSNYDLSHVTYDLLLTGRTDEAQGKEQKNQTGLFKYLMTQRLIQTDRN